MCVYLVIDWPRMVIISQTHSGIHKNNNINNFGIRKIFIIYDVYRTQKMMNVNKKKIIPVNMIKKRKFHKTKRIVSKNFTKNT